MKSAELNGAKKQPLTQLRLSIAAFPSANARHFGCGSPEHLRLAGQLDADQDAATLRIDLINVHGVCVLDLYA